MRATGKALWLYGEIVGIYDITGIIPFSLSQDQRYAVQHYLYWIDLFQSEVYFTEA